MCGCGCGIISSLMKRLGRTACCSHLLSCSQASDQLQRLAARCPTQPKVVLYQGCAADLILSVDALSPQAVVRDDSALRLRRTEKSLAVVFEKDF
ncbi:hypothetical protein P4O66_001898 [Electrophorus voltai]|uniref:Uncharacterized protein n=1 Tax=Electrophorus voltai TaxID=2609070 RepID=A0AAD9DS88_9TELE|nr:hypothetical protein P4O66_001898 [Electrophorus voltai]